MLIHGADAVGPSVAAFLTDAQVPIVSYAATQSQLTNDDEYNYFSRTIPSDRDEAMVNIAWKLLACSISKSFTLCTAWMFCVQKFVSTLLLTSVVSILLVL